MDETRINRLISLFGQLADLGGARERTKILTNREVVNAAPAGMADYVIVEDEGGYYIPAVKVPGSSYANGDLVNVLLIQGTEPIAFQHGSGSPSSGVPVHDHSDATHGGPDLHAVEEMEFDDAAALTIDAAGAITRTQVYHEVDTNGGAASDNLDTINGGVEGDLLIIKAADSARTVVVRHNQDNIWLSGAADISLDDADDHLALIYDGTYWCDIGWSAGGAGGAWKLGNLIVLSSSGDGDVATVAAAFAAAGAGDTILVDQGTYTCDGETIPDEVVMVGVDPTNCVLTSVASDVTLYLGSGNHVANLKIINAYNVAAGYCINVPNTSADIPTIRNLFLLQIGHTDGYCMQIEEDVNVDTCRMYSIDGGGILMVAGGTAYVFGGKIEADPSAYAVDNGAGGAVYLFGDPLLINGVNGSVDGQYVDETGLTHNLTGLDLEGVADALILDADGDTTISAPTDDQIDIEASGADQLHIVDGKLYPDADNDIDLGDATHEFKDGYIDGVLYADTVDLDGNADALVLDADGDTTISAPTDDQVDFEVSGSDVAVLTTYGLSAKNHAFIVKNSSGGAVTAGDVGYIDEAGEYVETTTEHDDVAWCVVVLGGADASDIYVANRGRATVTMDQNCSAGDYLYTSTTAGQATSETYVRSEVFAVALTANGAGSGGTCEALLLCHTRRVVTTSSNNAWYVAGHAATDFQSTINGAPNATTVVYGAVTSGNENVVDPQSSSELGKMILWNITRGTGRLIEDVNTGTNTITTVNTADTWADTDAIEIRSQTCNSGGSPYFIDIDLALAAGPGQGQQTRSQGQKVGQDRQGIRAPVAQSAERPPRTTQVRREGPGS